MSTILSRCPFCGSTDVWYSVKTTTINFEKAYHTAMYCYKCNDYESRTLVTEKLNICWPEDLQDRTIAEQKWNRRVD